MPHPTDTIAMLFEPADGRLLRRYLLELAAAEAKAADLRAPLAGASFAAVTDRHDAWRRADRELCHARAMVAQLVARVAREQPCPCGTGACMACDDCGFRPLFPELAPVDGAAAE